MLEKEQNFHRFATLRESAEGVYRYAANSEFAKGTIVRCPLGKGVEMYFFEYDLEKNTPMGGFDSEDVLEIFYCIEGAVRLDYADSSYLLTDNMIGVYDFDTCPRSIVFESRRFVGISLLLEGVAADETVGRYIRKAAMSLAEIKRHASQQKEVFTCFGNHEMRKVFLSIAENPLGYDLDLLRLKAMELVLISGRSLSCLMAEQATAGRRSFDLRAFDAATRYMADNLSDAIAIGQVARAAGVSTTKLQRLFSDFCGQSVYRQLRIMRLDKARQLLRQGRLSVTDVAAAVGWQNPSKFSAAFKQEHGSTPRQFQRML
jgi:AraC-like DNA-binding protein